MFEQSEAARIGGTQLRKRDQATTTTFACPSDTQDEAFEGAGSFNGVATKFARGNYACNGGGGNNFSTGDYALSQARGPFSMGGRCTALAGITDGTSNVLLAAEIIVANRLTDVRGAWAYPVGSYFCGGSRYNNPPTPQVFLRPNGNALDDTRRDRNSFCSSDNSKDSARFALDMKRMILSSADDIQKAPQPADAIRVIVQSLSELDACPTGEYLTIYKDLHAKSSDLLAKSENGKPSDLPAKLKEIVDLANTLPGEVKIEKETGKD